MNDFLPPEPKFKKGAAKPQELKPWQTSFNGKIAQKVRCWDDPLGCEQFVVRGDAKWHPHLCDSCVTALCNDYQVDRRDADILTLLIKQDESLQKSARVLGGNEDKLEALRKGRTVHIPQLLRSMIPVWKDHGKVATLNKTYRLWFYDQAGVDTAKSRKPAPGFAQMDAAVPVGDRV